MFLRLHMAATLHRVRKSHETREECAAGARGVPRWVWTEITGEPLRSYVRSEPVSLLSPISKEAIAPSGVWANLISPTFGEHNSFSRAPQVRPKAGSQRLGHGGFRSRAGCADESTNDENLFEALRLGVVLASLCRPPVVGQRLWTTAGPGMAADRRGSRWRGNPESGWGTRIRT